MDTTARELPVGWAWADLETLANKQGVISDGDWVESKDQNPEGSVRLIQLADVGELKFVDKSKRFMDLNRTTEMNCLFLMEGDLLIARLGDPVGKACLLPKLSQKCVTAVDVMVFRPENLNAVDKNYIAYVINSPRLRNKINLQLSGTTRKRITGKKLKVTKFPFPPIEEQGRIVDKIDELFSAIEAGERAIEQARAGVARYRKAILKAAVTGELTRDWRDENPTEESAEALLDRILTTRYEAWEKSELEKLDAKGKARPETEKQWEKFRGKYASPLPRNEGLKSYPASWLKTNVDMVTSLVTKGTTPKKHDMNGDGATIPYLKVYNLNFHGSVDFTIKPTFVTPDIHNNSLARSRLYPGDVIINIVGPPLGQAAIISDQYPEWNMNQAIAVLRPIEQIMSGYLLTITQSDEMLQWAISKAKATSGQVNLTLEICRNIPIGVPPLEEQAEIVDRVQQALSKADAVEATLDAQSRQAKALKQAVLKTAFEGRLVPQNPNDEPASELLKRIKEQT